MINKDDKKKLAHLFHFMESVPETSTAETYFWKKMRQKRSCVGLLGGSSSTGKTYWGGTRDFGFKSL